MKSFNIKENYVPFEMAMALKKKGFDEKCFAVYNMKGSIIHNSYFKINYNEQIWAPTIAMTLAWLRKLGIEIFINKLNETSKFNHENILRAFYYFDIANNQAVSKEKWQKNALENEYDDYNECAKGAINQVLENWDFFIKECNQLQNLKKNNKKEQEMIERRKKEEEELKL